MTRGSACRTRLRLCGRRRCGGLRLLGSLLDSRLSLLGLCILNASLGRILCLCELLLRLVLCLSKGCLRLLGLRILDAGLGCILCFLEPLLRHAFRLHQGCLRLIGLRVLDGGIDASLGLREALRRHLLRCNSGGCSLFGGLRGGDLCLLGRALGGLHGILVHLGIADLRGELCSIRGNLVQLIRGNLPALTSFALRLLCQLLAPGFPRKHVVLADLLKDLQVFLNIGTIFLCRRLHGLALTLAHQDL
mmetsp:Transcript_124660/g.399383  ORF Transcript_124660/g.399383 Transcript_124660/m.399383 type:complete len:248 (-) Transcript_124660:503-1246(-)